MLRTAGTKVCLIGIKRGIPPTFGQCRRFNLSKLIRESGTERYQSYTVNKKFLYPPELVYEVVSSVDKYEQFVPFCRRSFINQRDAKGEPSIAGLEVGFKEFDEAFTCKLHCEKPRLVVAKSVTERLFEFLETEWTIEPLTQTSCNVKLKLKYDFKSTLYNQVSSLFAGKVATVMTRSFEKRSYELFKKREAHKSAMKAKPAKVTDSAD
ncbi:hypothetical protein FOA43_003192 [Brettanomyces nanus]|uniref:Coenzyme Q-binding protein COQ10 START domain-containing protein n=1 Tax=Eeniella nana TaxID=13502 RepID=A0A875RQ38_EENNA|nr:uncharacterized protein FOA43_003192 [Brettanomyces nanus]QPG75830.1 hypothetical protein FOA43_003192 [Brettanomyces nanus]